MIKQVFITGTDTSVGKSLIAAWICMHTKYSYWKPVQTGNYEESDSNVIKSLSKVKISPETYSFKEPLSPHAAALQENVIIDANKFFIPTSENLVIEGIGGVLVPINDNFMVIDLIKKLNLPVILVARSSIGTINHTCLTLAALRAKKINILGIIINGPINISNSEAIAKFGQVKILKEFPFLNKVTLKAIKNIPLSISLKQIFGLNL